VRQNFFTFEFLLGAGGTPDQKPEMSPASSRTGLNRMGNKLGAENAKTAVNTMHQSRRLQFSGGGKGV